METWTKTCGLPLLFNFEPHPNGTDNVIAIRTARSPKSEISTPGQVGAGFGVAGASFSSSSGKSTSWSSSSLASSALVRKLLPTVPLQRNKSSKHGTEGSKHQAILDSCLWTLHLPNYSLRNCLPTLHGFGCALGSCSPGSLTCLSSASRLPACRGKWNRHKTRPGDGNSYCGWTKSISHHRSETLVSDDSPVYKY